MTSDAQSRGIPTFACEYCERSAIMINKIRFSDEELFEVFGYLDALRKSGKTNMYGARPYVMRRLGFEDKKAAKAVTLWMKTFSTGEMDDRVEKALELQAHEV